MDFPCNLSWKVRMRRYWSAKSMARRASLQGHQILTSEELFDFLSNSASKVQYLWLSSVELETITVLQEQRFLAARPIRNCRSYHHFVPISLGRLKCFRIAGADSDAFVAGQPALVEYNSLRTGMFVATVYDRKWYISKIVEISENDQKNYEILASSMTQRRDLNLFSWPRKEDLCYFVDTNVICVISSPRVLDSRRGSTYSISGDDFDQIQKCYRQWLDVNT